MKRAQCFSSNKPQKSVPSFAKLLFLHFTKPKKSKKEKGTRYLLLAIEIGGGTTTC
jgi:hypothetical protein